MRTALASTDQFLRGAGPFAVERVAARPAWWLPALVIAFAPIYGAMMGSYQVDSLNRLLQVPFAALKLPLLLFGTTALCLPAFFVLNTILGLRDDFKAATQAILAAQAALSIILAALAPITRFWYASFDDYQGAILFNAAMFSIATLGGQVALVREYRPLIRKNPRHALMAVFWLAIYSFVGIQMGWMLRPFIGDPSMPISFFRAEPFSNAYVVIAELITHW